MGKRTETAGNLLQTLRRGMQTLTLVADRPEGVSIAQIAEILGVDRAIAYRIVATLEVDGFLSRASTGHIHLGGAILALASNLEPQLRSLAEPVLRRLADETNTTAYMSVARGNEAEAILVAESSSGLIQVGYRPGSRHPINLGAAGIAILAARPEGPEDSEDVLAARRDGYSVTRGQLQRGAIGIASALRFSQAKQSALEASIGVVALEDLDVEAVAPLVVACARELTGMLSR